MSSDKNIFEVQTHMVDKMLDCQKVYMGVARELSDLKAKYEIARRTCTCGAFHEMEPTDRVEVTKTVPPPAPNTKLAVRPTKPVQRRVGSANRWSAARKKKTIHPNKTLKHA